MQNSPLAVRNSQTPQKKPSRSRTNQVTEDGYAQLEGRYGTLEAGGRDKEAVRRMAYRWWRH